MTDQTRPADVDDPGPAGPPLEEPDTELGAELDAQSAEKVDEDQAEEEQGSWVLTLSDGTTVRAAEDAPEVDGKKVTARRYAPLDYVVTLADGSRSRVEFAGATEHNGQRVTACEYSPR